MPRKSVEKTEVTPKVEEEVKKPAEKSKGTEEKPVRAKRTPAAKKEEVKKEEVKTEEVKAETVKAEAVKAEAVKKAEAPKKAEPAKKVQEKKEIQTEVYIQYAGAEYKMAEIMERIKEAWVADGHKAGFIKNISIYVKPEENAVYYVINEKNSGKIDL